MSGLDTPLLEAEHGEGTLDKHFPAMVRQYERYGVDIRKDPVLIYPTLHYQNGGVKIDVNGETSVKNLFVAGETSGGLHGRKPLNGQFAFLILWYLENERVLMQLLELNRSPRVS